MANVQIYRFQFLQNNPFGSFVAGDVLDIFLETDDAVVPANPLSYTADGITVLLNNVNYPVSGSGVILDFSPSIVSIQEFNPQICIGTSLLVFSTYGPWPYSTYYSQENHYSCTVNPPTCNLMVVGVPAVVPATDSATADGSIQITASSTNPIQYKIQSDFVYDDGTAQTDGTFSALLPGSYRIYLRDSANCGVNVLAEVTVNNLYGTKYRLEYLDNNLAETRIDVVRRGYSGSIFEICGSGTPFEIQLRGEGSQDKFDALLSSQANLNLVSETDLQFLELYTNDPNLYRIHYSKKFGAGSITSIVLPALSTWLTSTLSGTRPDWTVGGSTPSVTVAGSVFPNAKTSEELYTDYSFVPGDAYSLTLEFTRLTNSGSSNPRSGTLKITDTSFNIIFLSQVASVEGSNTVTLSFTATADCERIAFTYSSGSNVTITVTDVSGTTNGHDLKGVYKVLPQQYQEEYKAPPYYVSIQATDGLPEIKNYYLIQSDGQRYFGEISLIKLVAHCLRPIKLDLPIRVACNLYAIDMDQTDSDDPFDQAYIDFECFYLAEKEPTLDFVLRSILDTFRCRITQWEGRWNIVRVEEMIAAYDYRDFDSNGEYITHGTYNPIIDIEYPDDSESDDLLLANRDHNLEIKPGYGKLKAIYSLGLKPNILKNGDFRLKIAPDSNNANGYSLKVDKEGWTLVNAGYPVEETYEQIDAFNVAYKMVSRGAISGMAYLQSEVYNLLMGTNNQLAFSIRCKVGYPAWQVGTITHKPDVPYIKIRIQIRYSDLYLKADGNWATSENLLVFYATEFNKYVEFNVTANYPQVEPSTRDFDVRVYHAYTYHAQFSTLSDLKAYPTVGILNGFKTEIRTDELIGVYGIFFYKLSETTDTPDDYQIIRPDDYNEDPNPLIRNAKQWVLDPSFESYFVEELPTSPPVGAVHSFSIDYVKIKYLTDGKDPIDTIVRTIKGENQNPLFLEKKFIIGSYSSLIVTEITLPGLDLGWFFGPPTAAVSSNSILSPELIYTGWLRDANGNGYEFFKRDGIAESDKLHGIALKSHSLQYKKSWRLLRGSIYAQHYFGLLNTARNTNDSNRIYLPMGLTLNDKKCTWSGEFLELKNIGGDSDGSGTSPFSSGFTVGFGASGFN